MTCDTPQYRVLIFEDNEANLDVLSRRLIKRGYSVFSATDARDASSQVRSTKPDLILMDLEMPGVSGFDALQTIRQTNLENRAPIFAVTAHATEFIRIQCNDAGFDGFFPKPLDFSALLAAIETALGAEQGQRRQSCAEGI